MILARQLASAADVQRFRTEAENAAILDHPNIVPIYEVGEREGQPYFSMKLVEGGSLAPVVGRGTVGSKEAARKAAELLATVAGAVHYAHQRGVLHRDLKPGNIMIDGQGQPQITDFGLARRMEGHARLTQSGAIVGTPSYMPPEQARAEKGLTTAVDVYSLGAILYELLTGQPPFQAPTPLDTLLQMLETEPLRPRLLNPAIDRDLETICLKCLQKEPKKRYATAADLADDLRRFIANEPIQARPVGRWERAVKWARRRPAVAGLLVALVLAVLGLAIGGTWFTLRLQHALGVAEDERDKAVQAQGAADASAEDERKAREQAQAAQKHAEEEKHRADASAEAERIAKEKAQCLVYARQIALAQSYWREGNVAAARDQLEACQWNLRGWEHRYLWTLFNHYNQRTLVGHTDGVLSVVFSPDGQHLASGDGEGILKVWDARTGKETLSLKPHTRVTSVVFSPDSKRLASVCSDGMVKVWDSQTGQQSLIIKGHTSSVSSVGLHLQGTPDPDSLRGLQPRRPAPGFVGERRPDGEGVGRRDRPKDLDPQGTRQRSPQRGFWPRRAAPRQRLPGSDGEGLGPEDGPRGAQLQGTHRRR
jgi:hypothetical protein